MNEIKPQEKDLVIRLIQDDEKAFAELYAMYKNRMIYYAMTFLKSNKFAEDIFQDAFAVIWQTRKFINPDESFSAYLFSIVRNRILNLIRNMNIEENVKERILSQAIDYTKNTEEKIAENDLHNIISQATSKLTDRQHEIFEMSRTEGLSHKEIADKLNISVNTVQSHITSSLKILQDYLRKHYGSCAGLILILFYLK
jgi:RNA polymerase sigma-70 factor (ECF subfamily)